MDSHRLLWTGALLFGCTSAPRPVVVATVAERAPDAAVAVVDAAPSAPAVDPCAAGTLHVELAGLTEGQVLADTATGELHRRHDRVIALSGLFPVLVRDGNTVLAVAKSDVLPNALVALVVPGGAAADPGRRVTGPALAVLTCRAGEGYGFAARPFLLGTEARMQLITVSPTALPGGAHGATAMVLSYVTNGDSHTTAYLLGVSTDELPVRQPRAASVGVVAVIGAVGESVFDEGTHEPRSIVPLDATGWYPTGPGEQVFVRVGRERTPGPAGRATDNIRVVQLARLGRLGFTSAVGGDPNGLWFLMGSLGEPSWCANNPAARCGRLTIDTDMILDGNFGASWMAGAWPVTGPAPRTFTASGARWFYAGQWEGAGPPRDPTGQPPLTALRVQPVAGASAQ